MLRASLAIAFAVLYFRQRAALADERARVKLLRAILTPPAVS